MTRGACGTLSGSQEGARPLRQVESAASRVAALSDRVSGGVVPGAEAAERKRAGDELAAGPRIPEINAFLDGEMGRLSQALAAIPRGSAPDWEALDGVFRESLVEVWDGRRTGS